jgi:hypothetical protein
VRRAILALIVALASCAPQHAAAPPATSDGAPVYVDVARVVASSTFAIALAQYDVDLATLRRAAGDGAFVNVRAQITNAVADSARRLDAGARHVAGLRVQPVRLPANAPVTSGSDFTSEVAPFRKSVQARVERAVSLRAAQMREHEATVAYDFERAHAGRRLVLQLKLRDLHVDAVTRRNYQVQIAELDRQEAALVSAARVRDNATLGAYRAQLDAEGGADTASMAADVAAHARSTRNLAKPDMQAAQAWLPHWKDDVAETREQFAATRADITSRLLVLRAAGDSARSSLRDEITGLQRERDALHAQIVASIEARARQIAAARHLGRVYTDAAPAGARDVTDAVLRSYCVSTGSYDGGRCRK